MKKIILSIGVAALSCFCLTSCLKDLDALPLNPTDATAESVYGTELDAYVAGLSKVYQSLFSIDGVSNVGNTSHAQFLMGYWLLGECTTDEAKAAWSGDTWPHYLNNNTWDAAQLDPTYGLYAHAMLGVAYVNEFLQQTADDKLTARGVPDDVRRSIQSLRCEARFIRAFHYWALVDVFGNIPFVDESSPIGKNPPVRKTRTEAFDWLVKELEELAASEYMPAAASNYPRADKGSVLGLLVRLYLNAEVYIGTPMWSEAATACEKIFALDAYELCPEYSWLFCGDNGENPESVKEIMLGCWQDYEHTNWNWGGTTMLIASEQNVDVLNEGYLLGFNDYWGGLRMPSEFVYKFFGPTGVDYETGDYTIDDKRGQLFYIKGRSEVMEDMFKFEQGWGVHKWSNVPHDKTPEEYVETAKTRMFADTDYIFMRLAEIYLAYAEACLELGRKSDALPYLNKLLERAGVSTVSDYDEDFLFGEYSRELYWESNRRRDLIRFGKFCSSDYIWKWKGGTYDGQSFPEYMEIFAIPVSELQANKNLKQNPGYEE